MIISEGITEDNFRTSFTVTARLNYEEDYVWSPDTWKELEKTTMAILTNLTAEQVMEQTLLEESPFKLMFS